MAGVASPMFRRHARDGAMLLSGLLVGEVVAGLVLASLVVLFGSLLGIVLPTAVRLVLVVAAAVAFGAADWRGRTPQVSRQVPKNLAHRLTPGKLGLVWGFDLGLLFTTQKTVSLLWLSLVAVLLLDPGRAPVALIIWAVTASLAIVTWTLMPRNRLRLAQEEPWIRIARRMSAVTMVLAAAFTILATAV